MHSKKLILVFLFICTIAVLPLSASATAQTPEQIHIDFPVTASASLVIPGYQSLMSTPTSVACFTDYDVSVSCSYTLSTNSLNSNYSDINVTLSSVTTGYVRVTGIQTFTYYVDSVNGSDSNTGTSPSQAFATISKVLSVSPQQGQSIGLAANSSWREQLTMPYDYMSAQSYGTGTMPLLDASDLIATSSWTKTPGFTNLYQATLSFEAVSGTTDVSIWENSNRLIRYATTSQAEATSSSFSATYSGISDDISPMTFYVHTSDGTSPATNGKSYYYTKRRNGYRDGGPNSLTRGIWARRNVGMDGSIVISGKLYDSLASEGSKHNVYVPGGAYLNGVTALDAYLPEYQQGSGDHTYFVYNQNVGAGENVTFVNTVATSTTYDPNAVGIYGHVNVSGQFGTIKCLRCSMTNIGSPFNTNNAANSVFDHGIIRGPGTALNANEGTLTVLDSDINAGSSAVLISSGTNVVAQRNIFRVSSGYTSRAFIFPGASSLINDNVFYGSFGFYYTSASTTILRNAFLNSDSYFFGFSTGQPTLSDYNYFLDPSGNRFNINNIDYNLAGYRALSGNETHSATPNISAVATSSVTTSGVSVGWTSDWLGSSAIDFGLTSAYGGATAVTDTSTMVQSHAVTLSGLPACTTYHYRVRTANSYTSLTGSSTDQTFTTLCTGNAAVSNATSTAVASSTTASITSNTLTLSVPIGVTSNASTTFQIKQLDPAAFIATAGAPTSKTMVGSTVYNLKAVAGVNTNVSTFSQPLTVTLSYNPSDVAGLSEQSLSIYRYDGSSWNALSNCSIDTNAHTVSCQTSNFSDFALFATTPVTPTVSVGGGSYYSSGGGGGNSYTPSYVTTSVPVVSTVVKNPVQNPVVMSTYSFTKDLKLGAVSGQVKLLQQYLNTHGYVIAKSGAGSVGKETNTFGSLTRAALIKFQKENGIKPASGYFGPLTRKYIQNH